MYVKEERCPLWVPSIKRFLSFPGFASFVIPSVFDPVTRDSCRKIRLKQFIASLCVSEAYIHFFDSSVVFIHGIPYRKITFHVFCMKRQTFFSENYRDQGKHCSDNFRFESSTREEEERREERL